jgi:hypothetical protein
MLNPAIHTITTDRGLPGSLLAFRPITAVIYRPKSKALNVGLQVRQFWGELPLTPQDIDLLGRLFSPIRRPRHYRMSGGIATLGCSADVNRYLISQTGEALHQSRDHRKLPAERARLAMIGLAPANAMLDAPPLGLSTDAATVWLRIAPALICKRLIQPADAWWFQRFCTAYAIWLRATHNAVSGKFDTERRLYTDVALEFGPLIDEFLEDIDFHSPAEFENFLSSWIQ